ncbi:hypothetical protein DERF_000106, partial [Dermatophagoides farinae]
CREKETKTLKLKFFDSFPHNNTKTIENKHQQKKRMPSFNQCTIIMMSMTEVARINVSVKFFFMATKTKREWKKIEKNSFHNFQPDTFMNKKYLPIEIVFMFG